MSNKEENMGPTWKWLSGIAITVVGFFAVLWMGNIASNGSDTAKTSRESADTLTKLLAIHGERIAATEAATKSFEARADRIENTLERVETKLDHIIGKEK